MVVMLLPATAEIALILEFIQNGCALAIIGFMLYVTFFDVLDFRGGGGAPKFATPAGQTANP